MRRSAPPFQKGFAPFYGQLSSAVSARYRSWWWPLSRGRGRHSVSDTGSTLRRQAGARSSAERYAFLRETRMCPMTDLIQVWCFVTGCSMLPLPAMYAVTLAAKESGHHCVFGCLSVFACFYLLFCFVWWICGSIWRARPPLSPFHSIMLQDGSTRCTTEGP